MRVLGRVAAWLFAGVTLAGLTLEPYSRPPGPIGWETRITTGFDPPVEYVLVFGVEPGESYDDLSERWGPDAKPLLMRLYRDPDWRRQKHTALNLLAQYADPDVAAFAREEMPKLIETPVEDRNRQVALQPFLRMIATQDADEAIAIAFRVLNERDDGFAANAMWYLFGTAETEQGDTVNTRLAAFARDNPHRATAQRILSHLETAAAERRAHESMTKILTQETHRAAP